MAAIPMPITDTLATIPGRNAARFRQLDDMARRLKKLEGKLERES